MIITYTLVIMMLGNFTGESGGMTSVPGYTTLESCRVQAEQVMRVQTEASGRVPRRRIQALCVEVK